jgi:hypothetical protein
VPVVEQAASRPAAATTTTTTTISVRIRRISSL